LKNLSLHRVFRNLLLAALMLPSGVPPTSAQEASGKANASPWTESDSRLANHYIQLLQKDPSYGKVLDLLWGLYEKKDQTALLLDYFKQASDSGPAVAKLIYAHLLRKGGDLETARLFYDQALEADPSSLPALRALAEIADQQKRWAKALSLYTRLVELIPATDEEGLAIRLRKAAIHRIQGQNAEAVADWNALLKASPANIALRTEIVGLLLEAGATEAAVGVLTELARSEDPRQRLDALLELNRLHEFTGDFDGAVATSHEAMAVLHFKSPDYADLFSRLVRIHERDDRLDEFEAALTTESESENPTARALHDLAEYHRLTADPAKEEQAVARLAARLPGDSDHRIRLAELQMRNDRYEAAAATLDALIAGDPGAPLDLVLRRALVDLQSKGREAAADRLGRLLDGGTLDAAGRREVLDFARTHYLDSLVERLLSDPTMVARDSSDETAAPIELARFLHERGRSEQAIATLREHATGATGPTLEKAARLHQIGSVFDDLGLKEEALAAFDQAIALAPENLEYQSSRADLYIGLKDVAKAIAQLESIRAGQPDLDSRAEIDQRLFSLIRGHYATEAEKGKEDEGLSAPQQGGIRSPAEYRRAAAAANQSTRGGDEPAPAELMAYYEKIKQTAKETPTTERRYRAAWWAFKLQDNQECFEQLNLANEEAGKPVVEVEKMLLLLAEQNERTTLMVRHLSTLIEIDPANADDYRQRRAATRFELGFEDEAVRELKDLAAKPAASLATLNTLANVYQRQGSSVKQVEVWQRAYREADLFGKRGIIKQLTTALIESGRPEEALKVQLDLLERETDPLQRRKQLDGQLTVAQSHYLLEWMRDRYGELAARHPFDRFYPEALARIHRAAGQDREAYEAMKKAYYMSGRSDELLGELGALSDQLGDLQSAIYYRRQLLARGEGDTLENWKELVRMLEKDLRVNEADQLRERLVTKFGSDTDFLAELTDHYLKNGNRREAERTLQRLVALRGWDLEARFRLGLLQVAQEEHEKAFGNFSTILAETADIVYPERFGDRLLPLLRVAPDPDGTDDATMDEWVFTVEAYPFVGGNLQDEIGDALRQPRPEFTPAPKEAHLIRLRAIEEAAALAARLGRVPAWLAEWNAATRPRFERLWATRHSGAGAAFADLLKEYPATSSHTDQLFLAHCHLLAGDAKRFLAWVGEDSAISGTQHPRSIYGALAALILLKDQPDDPLCDTATLYESLDQLGVPKTIAAHQFSELRKAGLFLKAYEVGRRYAGQAMADEGAFHFALSQVAGFAGFPAEREHWLDRALRPDPDSSGTRVSNHFYAALTEKLSLLDTDAERADYLRRVEGSFLSGHLGERERLERALHLSLAAGDHGPVIAGLRRLVTLQARSSRPATIDASETGHEQNQTWQKLDRTLHHYAERLHLDAEGTADFVEAIGGEILLSAADATVSGQFEQFEIDRNLLLLEWMNAPERESFLRELRGFLKEPDSRIELAKALESRGFYREAAPVYRDDAILRDRDYAPLQGMFDAAAEGLSPGLALDVIAKINTREFPAPPGLTADYLNEQHARFLLMDGDLERLGQLGRQPVVGEDASPVANRAHLPYQNALAEAYRRDGKDDALLGLLTDLRSREAASISQLLLGAETLAQAGRHGEALAWLRPIALDPSEAVPQRRAILLTLTSQAATDWPDPDHIRTLALASLDRQPASLTRRLAVALHEAGHSDDAVGVLQILRRKTRDGAQRTTTSLELLQLQRSRGKSWAELADTLESYFLDFVYQSAPADLSQAETDPTGKALPGLEKPNASGFIEWITADPEAARDLPALLSAMSIPTTRRWLPDLLAASFRGQLETAARQTLGDLAPHSPEALRLLETLPAFGPIGIATARGLVDESRRPGDAFFPHQPHRQIAFFHRLGDRERLIEVHSTLVREAGSDFFHQSGLEEWVPTLDNRGRIPLLFAAAGETGLARSLFQSYERTLTSYQWNHLGFLNDYATFLIDSRAYPEAETLLRRILQKSLRVDLRLLPRLYAAWGKIAEWETRTRDLCLTRGQEVLLRGWITALAEGRELREIRDSW